MQQLLSIIMWLQFYQTAHSISLILSLFTFTILTLYSRRCRQYARRLDPRFSKQSQANLSGKYSGGSTHRLTLLAIFSAIIMSILALLPSIVGDISDSSSWPISWTLMNTYTLLLQHTSFLTIAFNMFLLIVRRERDVERRWNWNRFCGVVCSVPIVIASINWCIVASSTSSGDDLVFGSSSSTWTWSPNKSSLELFLSVGWLLMLAIPAFYFASRVAFTLYSHKIQSQKLEKKLSSPVSLSSSCRTNTVSDSVMYRAVALCTMYGLLIILQLVGSVNYSTASISSRKYYLIIRGTYEAFFGVIMFLIFGTGHAVKTVLRDIYKKPLSPLPSSPKPSSIKSNNSSDSTELFGVVAKTLFGSLSPRNANSEMSFPTTTVEWPERSKASEEVTRSRILASYSDAGAIFHTKILEVKPVKNIRLSKPLPPPPPPASEKPFHMTMPAPTLKKPPQRSIKNKILHRRFEIIDSSGASLASKVLKMQLSNGKSRTLTSLDRVHFEENRTQVDDMTLFLPSMEPGRFSMGHSHMSLASSVSGFEILDHDVDTK